MKTPGFRLFAAIAALYALPLAAQPRRIAGAIENSRRIALAGRVHRQATAQNDAGPVENTFVVSDMRLYLRPSGEAGLDQLLQEQQDPASPNYHKWLTPEQYGDRFGASADDTKQIAAWLESQGFTGVEVGRGRTWIRFSGTAQQVGNAFQTEVHRYNVRGVAHFANASDPTLPAAIAGVVSGISGLHDFRMEPRLRKVEPLMNTSFGHNLAPDDVATIYNIKPLLDAGIDGTGQRIAVVGQSAIRTSDIANFRSRFGLPAIDLQPVRVGRVNVPIRDGDVDEAHLDIEWSGAVARKATIVYYYADSVWDAAIEAVSRNTEKVISMSYGFCENADLVSLPQYRQIVQQAVAQGITWFAASGDSGAGDCEDRSASVAQNGFAVDSPGSIPEITAMGGTQFDDDGGGYWAASNGTTGASALGYIPERVWNTNGSGGIGGGGGGVSLVFPRPSWQAGLGPGGSGRMTPDISLNSASQHVGYFVYSGGIAYFGGTSVAAPLMAGVASLLNHYLVSTGAIPQAGLGNINPTLYRMAATPAGAEVFHDVVNGDNGVACVNGTPDCANGYFGHSARAGLRPGDGARLHRCGEAGQALDQPSGDHVGSRFRRSTRTRYFSRQAAGHSRSRCRNRRGSGPGSRTSRSMGEPGRRDSGAVRIGGDCAAGVGCGDGDSNRHRRSENGRARLPRGGRERGGLVDRVRGPVQRAVREEPHRGSEQRGVGPTGVRSGNDPERLRRGLVQQPAGGRCHSLARVSGGLYGVGGQRRPRRCTTCRRIS